MNRAIWAFAFTALGFTVGVWSVIAVDALNAGMPACEVAR